jgi:N-acetylmuramoyl-L-alanine amidase
MNSCRIFFIILLYVSVITGQNIKQLSVVSGKETKYIPVYMRQGSMFIPVKQLADVLGINRTMLQGEEMVRYYFPAAPLVVTSKNPYLVIELKEGHHEVVQLPTSTYMIKNEIYIPLKYSIGALEKVLGSKLEFKEPDILVVKESKKKEEPVVNTNTKFNITGLSFDEKANGTLIRLKSNKKIPSYSSSFKDGVLTLTLRSVMVDQDKLMKTDGKGVVKDIKSKNTGKDAELRIYVTKEYSASEVINIDHSNDLMITIHNRIFSRKENRNKDKWDFNVIVIDAGHGGKDAGAIGINGVREKDVNLGVALKLGNLIEKNMKDVKVVYTRSNDTFIELYRRGKIANENGGKLFISIHGNSTPKRPTDASGFEVYLLRPGRTKEAIQIASRENGVIQYEDNPQRYQKLTDENFILVSMAHSSYMKYSEKFSDFLNREFNNGEMEEKSRGIKQAGFYVLVGASMPSVLIETGFLTNPKDAAFLKSDGGQSKIAGSILAAITKYREYYQQFIQTE